MKGSAMAVKAMIGIVIRFVMGPDANINVVIVPAII
jgi:hypothetical protein